MSEALAVSCAGPNHRSPSVRTGVPLSVLDLAPITAGSSAGDALRRSIDLAQRAEALGYRRYWLAEHHFAPGVASSAPAILIGQIAAATTTIRVGSGAVQTGHQTALAIVEQFGTLGVLFPGRIDLGLGRAEVAGERGLPFAANYHVSPATTLEAVDAYRRAFRPSATLPEPYVVVSADVVVAEDDVTAQHLASPYALWVRSIRTGQGAVEFPSPEDAAGHVWSDEDRHLVEDRVATQFVGSPATVADRLEVLQRVTGADELVVTTITHDHDDRVRSQELLAHEWAERSPAPTA